VVGYRRNFLSRQRRNNLLPGLTMDRKRHSLIQLLAFSAVLIGGQAFAASDQMPQTVSVTELRAEYQQSIRSGHWRGAHQTTGVHQNQKQMVAPAPVHNDAVQSDSASQNQQYERQDQQQGHHDDGQLGQGGHEHHS
jgi:hypothetical protein